SFYRVGNHADPHFKENGVHQDGAVLFFLNDKTVAGFFTKFDYQDTSTDEFGNPVHVGISELNSLKAIPEKVRRKVLKHRPPTAKLLKVVSDRAAFARHVATTAAITAAKAAGRKPKNHPNPPVNPTTAI